MQHAAYEVQHATYKVQHATYKVQHATYEVQHATYEVQHATYKVQHATDEVQHATYKVQHAAHTKCSMQHSAHPMQHITCRIDSAGCAHGAAGRAERMDFRSQNSLHTRLPNHTTQKAAAPSQSYAHACKERRFAKMVSTWHGFANAYALLHTSCMRTHALVSRATLRWRLQPPLTCALSRSAQCPNDTAGAGTSLGEAYS